MRQISSQLHSYTHMLATGTQTKASRCKASREGHRWNLERGWHSILCVLFSTRSDHSILMQGTDFWSIFPETKSKRVMTFYIEQTTGEESNVSICFLKQLWLKNQTLTWVLGKAEVLRVSWVSSVIFRLGILNIRAAWSAVAAIDVILNPLSHLRWIPSLGYKKSSSTTFIYIHTPRRHH